jgi:hypothetical protein
MVPGVGGVTIEDYTGSITYVNGPWGRWCNNRGLHRSMFPGVGGVTKDDYIGSIT